MRARVANLLLVVISVVATWLAAEAAFSLVGLRYLPLRLHADLPDDVRVFAQSSKDGVVPREPVLLVGDSHAQGLGDWLLQADPDRNGPFHSAHIIHALSGRDVVTLGVGAAGSAEGIAVAPAAAYAVTRDALYLRLPAPRVAVVYFYEGNDLNNNAAFLDYRVERPDAPGAGERIDRALTVYTSEWVRPAERWWHFPLLRFTERVVWRIQTGWTSAAAATVRTGDEPVNSGNDPQNVVEVAGQPVTLPASLQSPALELTQPDLERATLAFERSLAALRRLFADTPVLVVYLPSPLASYRLIGPDVSIQTYANGVARHPKERVAPHSDAICGLVRAAAVSQGAGFLDLRPTTRAASARDVLHGPRDFKHFNRKGMEMLGTAVAERIDRPLDRGACWQSVSAQ